MDMTVMTVTPEIAVGWLKLNTRNRSLRPRLVDAFARDMTDGNWALNGEAIKFASTGDLLDGQHRLEAIVKADVSVQMLVITGLPPAVQDTMDTGTKRTAADVLALNGYHNTILLAAVAKLVMSYQEGDTVAAWRSPTTAELEDIIAEQPEIVDAVDIATNYCKPLTPSFLPSVTCFAWWRLSQIDGPATKEFFDAIAFNATNGRGDPRHALLAALNTAYLKGNRSKPLQVGLTFRAWNAWRSGRSLSTLHYVPGPLPTPH